MSIEYHIKQAKDAAYKMADSSYQSPDAQGYYGKFGGAFIPEMLYPNVEELRKRYLEIMHEAAFQ